MTEKKMTLEELTGWLEDHGVPYEIDDAGRLAVKGDLGGEFRTWVENRKHTSLPDELSCVEGNLWLDNTSITSLGNLTSVKRSLNLMRTAVTSLDNLTSVGENLWVQGTFVTSLGNLVSVGGDLNLSKTPITSLGSLTSVGGDLNLSKTPITSLGNLTSVGEWLDLQRTPITSLGNLTSVGGDLDLGETPITSLDNLNHVGSHICLDQSQLRLLTREVLQKTAGGIRYWGESENNWVVLSPSELEAVIAENEARESLRNTRESSAEWDLYDR